MLPEGILLYSSQEYYNIVGDTRKFLFSRLVTLYAHFPTEMRLKYFCAFMTATFRLRPTHPSKEIFRFFARGAVTVVWGWSSERLCLFVFGWMVGWVGGGSGGGVGAGCDDEWKLLRVQRGSDQCHYCPVVAKWADSSISPCPMAVTTLMRVERGTFLPCKIPKTIIIPAREPTVLCNSLRRWEMTEPISAHTRPWELGAA